jgi:tetratricopeptide (TPR) repeat protein
LTRCFFACVIASSYEGEPVKIHGVIILVVAVFVLSLPGMYLSNKGKMGKWDLPDIMASEGKEDEDNPAVDMLCLKALMHLSDGEHEKAIAAYSEAIKLEPKYAFSYIGRGDVYLAKGDFKRALNDYDKAARLDPENDTAKERANVARTLQK